jgi:hypothetical protein
MLIPPVAGHEHLVMNSLPVTTGGQVTPNRLAVRPGLVESAAADRDYAAKLPAQTTLDRNLSGRSRRDTEQGSEEEQGDSDHGRPLAQGTGQLASAWTKETSAKNAERSVDVVPGEDTCVPTPPHQGPNVARSTKKPDIITLSRNMDIPQLRPTRMASNVWVASQAPDASLATSTKDATRPGTND